MNGTGKPSGSDRAQWIQYWRSEGQPWRTEPEISALQQQLWRDQLRSGANPNEGRYPFRDVTPSLQRADIEWLLEHLGDGVPGAQGPIDWSNPDQHSRIGLDLRGASLSGLDLSGLPLAGSLLRSADLTRAHLEGAHLEGTDLLGAELNHSFMHSANLFQARLDGAKLFRADLSDTTLVEVTLCGADLRQATLTGANMREAHFEPTSVDDDTVKSMQALDREFPEKLPAADLRGAFLDSATVLDKATLGNKGRGVAIADVRYGGVGLGAVDWAVIGILGDEALIGEAGFDLLDKKDRRKAVDDQYREAIRANLQLGLVLQEQGLLEESRYFVHQARSLQRKQYIRHLNLGSLLFSLILYGLTGDGWRVRYLVGWYFVLLLGFSEIYYGYGVLDGSPIEPVRALYMSALAFHRLSLGSNLWFTPGLVTATGLVESLVGLLIEASLISAFTFRLLGH